MANKYSYTSIEDFKSLIESEIIAAKGAMVEGVLDFFTTKDVEEIAENLFKRMERGNRQTIFSTLVHPMNDFAEAITFTEYDWISYLKPELVKLNSETAPKVISIVVPDETLICGHEAEYLFKLRKKLLVNPTNYLLGLMKLFKEKMYDFPSELFDYEITAFPSNKNDLKKYPGSEMGNYVIAGQKESSGQYGILRVMADPKRWSHKVGFVCEDL